MIDLKPPPSAAQRYHQAGYWQDQSLAQRIAASVAAYPDKTAVMDASGYRITYRTLDDKAARLAAFWQAHGLGVGDVVTMHLPNWWQTAVVSFAAFKLGAVINPLPPTYGWKDLAYVMNKSGARALVVANRFRSVDYCEHVRHIAPQLQVQPCIVVIGDENTGIGTTFADAVGDPRLAPTAAVCADDPALLLFTSGSESKPKGVVHTHNTAIYGEHALASTLGLSHEDVCFMASPVTHTSGFMHGILLTLMMGGTLSLLDIFKGDVAVDQMQASRASWTMGATPFLSDVVQSMQKTGKRLAALRYFLCGGAPIPEALVRRAQAVGVRVMSVYGSTESPPHTATWPQDPIEAAWQFDGRALPGVEVCAMDEDGKPVAPGQPGEQWSRGPHAFIGYLGEPELTARALDADGWYHSGDLATVGEQGAVRVVGRIKDMIIRGGQNVSPREVEDILLGHPACQAVAVVGLPDARLGERACAVVVCHPGSTLDFEAMQRYLIDRGVARFKLPEHLVLRDALPATPSGKIQKFKLREELKKLIGEQTHV